MPLNAYFHNFATTSINYIRPTYYYRSYKQTNVRQIAIKVDSSFNNGHLMVSQKDQRHKNISSDIPYTLLDTLGFVYHNDRVI